MPLKNICANILYITDLGKVVDNNGKLRYGK